MTPTTRAVLERMLADVEECMRSAYPSAPSQRELAEASALREALAVMDVPSIDYTLRASFVLGGFERKVSTVRELVQAIHQGSQISPCGEVTLRIGHQHDGKEWR